VRLQSLKPRVQGIASRHVVSTAQVERKRGTTGINDRNKIKQRDLGLCQECKRNGCVRVGDEVDHIIPLCDGGSDDSYNKELLCISCHSGKTKQEAINRGKPSNK
jgi:5-methylcytosine-specific restriction protein A